MADANPYGSQFANLTKNHPGFQSRHFTGIFMEVNSLLDQVFRRWETLLAAWNFYLVVAFVLLGLFILSKTARTERKVFRLLAVGWVFFAWTHLLGILYMVKQWTAVAAMLKEAIAARAGGTESVIRLAGAGIVEAPNAVWVVPFHLLLDAFVLFGMWVLCRSQPTSPPTHTGT